MELSEKIKLYRRLFNGRQDVYGKQWVRQFDGKEIKGYAPACDNFFKDFCHLKTKSGTGCASCEHKKWTPVSDESIRKHIEGEEVHIQYVLHPDGTLLFGSMDFDVKPGKEHLGHGFDAVEKVIKILRSDGVDYHIARSTTGGFHVYIFFGTPYLANRYRAYIDRVFELAGFKEELRATGKPLPEQFPKQSYITNNGIGNGIKTPMIETAFKRRRNCWVDSFNTPIGTDSMDFSGAQWDYMSRIVPQGFEVIDRIIETEGLDVNDDYLQSAFKIGPRAAGTRSGGSSTSDGRWQQPLTGSIEKILEGCSAYRNIKAKIDTGVVIGHDEGFALYHICMHTADGLDWFKKSVPGWGENERDLNQLNQSLNKNYAPWTCQKLQEKGICVAGTRCFEKKPPREIIDGMEVLRDDIPKEKWPEPSPIRYGFGRGEDFLLRLQAEVLEAKKESNEEKRLELMRNIAKRSQVFDAGQQKDFKEFVRKEKPLKRNDISKIFNEAVESYTEETKKHMGVRDDIVKCEDYFYQKDTYGYTLKKTGKDGKAKDIKISEFDIIIHEERQYIDDGDVKSSFSGIIRAKGFEKPFEIDSDSWQDNTRFCSFFGNRMGARFSPLRANLEYIRQAALGFSLSAGMDTKVYLTTQGYYRGEYLMPSCLIDKDGIKPNTTKQIDLKFKQTKNIDFKILSIEEVRELLSHIRVDFLRTWPENWVRVALAHTLFPCVMGYLGWDKRATLFLEGLTGSGKSELTHMCQFFYGKFDNLYNFMSSPKAIRELGYQFKDVLLVVDDYKNLSKEQSAAVKEAILNAYDGHIAAKLNINIELRENKSTRGVYMMTGEEMIANDAATIARSILIETQKRDMSQTLDSYKRVKEKRELYNGIPPHFIHWVYQRDKDAIDQMMIDAKNKLREGSSDAQNIERISYNLAVNYTIWTMFTGFMAELGVLDSKEKSELDFKHWTYMLELKHTMLKRCETELGSGVFLSLLSQLIASGEVNIDNLNWSSNQNKPIVGFVIKDQPIDCVYLYPDVVFEIVKNNTRNQPLLGSRNALLRQLEDQGAIAKRDKDKHTKKMRYGSRTVNVLAIYPHFVGINVSDAMLEDDTPTAKVINFKPLKREECGMI